MFPFLFHVNPAIAYVYKRNRYISFTSFCIYNYTREWTNWKVGLISFDLSDVNLTDSLFIVRLLISPFGFFPVLSWCSYSTIRKYDISQKVLRKHTNNSNPIFHFVLISSYKHFYQLLSFRYINIIQVIIQTLVLVDI